MGTNENPIYVYELKQNVTRPTETQLELTSENDHIREGGLVRIGGTYHRIDDVNGTTLSISPACNDTSNSVEEVYFPIAQVVDNTVAEQVKEFTAEGCINTKGEKMFLTFCIARVNVLFDNHFGCMKSVVA